MLNAGQRISDMRLFNASKQNVQCDIIDLENLEMTHLISSKSPRACKSSTEDIVIYKKDFTI